MPITGMKAISCHQPLLPTSWSLLAVMLALGIIDIAKNMRNSKFKPNTFSKKYMTT
jgi:hypothetical protein